ncbi:MAG: hypothetical protein KatS3mg060_0336 [Dehalococcoidia bacterium]|nr:MAG: hypothetical protein KatS3mg060_0336 [Dehalococcoidia bacterium]
MQTTVSLIANIIRGDSDRDPRGLTHAQLTDLVRWLASRSPTAAQDFIAALNASEMAVPVAVARAALATASEEPRSPK